MHVCYYYFGNSVLYNLIPQVSVCRFRVEYPSRIQFPSPGESIPLSLKHTYKVEANRYVITLLLVISDKELCEHNFFDNITRKRTLEYWLSYDYFLYSHW